LLPKTSSTGRCSLEKLPDIIVAIVAESHDVGCGFLAIFRQAAVKNALGYQHLA